MSTSDERETVNSRFSTWVVKVGSSVLANEDEEPSDRLEVVCEQISRLLAKKIRIVLVTSGAIAEGMSQLDLKSRPHRIYQLQAAAAVGQMELMIRYHSSFASYGTTTAEILLTHDDFADRTRYINVCSTLTELLQRGVVPIINENDTVSTEEIHFGDNDTLAARVASLVGANLLVLLTDQEGLHEEDPRINACAKLLRQTSAHDGRLEAMAGVTPGKLGRGGMKSKVEAARHAAQSGCNTAIINGNVGSRLIDLADGSQPGTLLTADLSPSVARKRWIASQLRTQGELHLDDGAVQALFDRGVSLLAVGVTGVTGDFRRGDFVRMVNSDGEEIGKGLVNYPSQDTAKILGVASEDIESILGYVDSLEVVHRDNLALNPMKPGHQRFRDEYRESDRTLHT